MKRIFTLILALLIYSFVGVFLLKYYQSQINPDAIAYISIAKKYLAGDMKNAINGYWSPLFSWLIVPFLYCKLPALFATKILSLMIGIITIVGVILFSYRFEMSEKIRRIIIIFSLIPSVLSFSLTIVTPDLLLLCFIVYYLNVIFNTSYGQRKQDGFLCGIIGSLAYLSKSYAFPFFISHFLIFNAIHYIKSKREDKIKILKNCILGFVIFFAISGTWIYLISAKYGYVTFGTAGKFNYALMGPNSKSYSTLDGLVGILRVPPNETAIYSFEEPCPDKIIESWSPFESWTSFKYQIKTILSNTYEIFLLMPVLTSTIIIGYMLFFCQPHHKATSPGSTFYPLLTIILYTAGYTPFIIAERYLWIVIVLLMLMAGCLLNALFTIDQFSKIKKYTMLLFFIFSFVVSPFEQLTHSVNAGKDIFELSRALGSEYNLKGNIASNTNRDNSLYLSFFLNCRYFGYYDSVNPQMSAWELLDDLQRHQIDYFFVWGKPDSRVAFLDDYKEITGGTIPSLKIFSLKEKIQSK